MKVNKGTVVRTAIGVVLTCIVVTVLFIAKNGVPIWGAPRPENVQSVTVKMEDDGVYAEFTDSEKIKLAVNLINTLNYQPFTPPSEKTGPDVTITYTLKDGRELTASANWITGWWNGEPHALKQPDVFVNLAKGVFYVDY